MISDFFFNSFFIRTEFTETNLHYHLAGMTQVEGFGKYVPVIMKDR